MQWIRHAYHIPAPNPYADGEISVADAAHRLGCSIGVVYDWIKTGKLAARRGTGNRLCIPWTEQHRSRMPLPHHRIRAPQPRRPPHHIPRARLNSPTMSVPAGIITPKDQADQRNSITDPNIPTHDCRRGSMKHPSPRCGTGSCRPR